MISIAATGHAFSGKYIQNKDLAGFPIVAIPLIKQKTGIGARYWVENETLTSDLAAAACEKCLQQVALDKSCIDVLILATSTPDRPIPACAARVARKLGLTRAFAFDINSSCSNSSILLQQARSFIASNFTKNVLVVAADCTSKILNPMDFSTTPYFGDAAAAALVSGEISSRLELMDGVFHTQGDAYEAITMRAGGCELPTHCPESQKFGFFEMNGKQVFSLAVEKVPLVVKEILEKHDLKMNDISQLIMHQANVNILKAVAKELRMGDEKIFINLDKYGNTAGASVLLALDEYLKAGQLRPDSFIIACSFGGGFSWGANLIRVTE